MRISLSLLAFALLVTGPAHAQPRTNPGNVFGYVDGLLLLPGSVGVAPRESEAKARDLGIGGGFAGKFGYQLDPVWDVAIGGSYLDNSAGQAGKGPVRPYQETDARLYVVDAEAGYTIRGQGFAVRPAVGLRYVQWNADWKDRGSQANAFMTRTTAWGIGPHVGVDGALNLSGPISLIGAIDTAFLYGKTRERKSVADGSSSPPNRNDERLIFGIGAKLGLDWEIAPLVHVAAGYQVQIWDGLNHKAHGRAQNYTGTRPFGRSEILEHGPFIRLAYAFGAPRAPAAP
jgi:hypothetical protein